MEVDYAGMRVPITNPETGEVTPAQVFVAVLPASSYTYAEIQPSQELQHWLSGHVHAFTFLGGTPKIIRPDNLKSGVRKPNYYEPDLNPSYQELAEHYHVAFEGHYYSVPHTLVGQEVRMRATEHMLEIFHRGQQVAIHPLSAVQGRFSTCPDHMPSNHRFVLNTDSDWLLREAAKIGPQTAAYMTAVLHSRPYPQQAFRTCLGILNLARKHPHVRLELACQHLLPENLLTYQDLKSELELLSKEASTDPLPAHENVRGDTYYH
jgi:transposase